MGPQIHAGIWVSGWVVVCKCGWYSRRPGVCKSGTRVSQGQGLIGPDLNIHPPSHWDPDQGGLTEEDGDEGGKDGVGEEGPGGDPRGQQVSNHLGSRRRSFQERVRRRTDLWVTPHQRSSTPNFHRRGSTTRCTLSVILPPTMYSFKSATDSVQSSPATAAIRTMQIQMCTVHSNYNSATVILIGRCNSKNCFFFLYICKS